MVKLSLATILKGNLSQLQINIDIARLIESRMLIQANSGGGKSYAIRKLLEVTHGKVQQIVIDIEGEFSSLREKYDYILIGKGENVDVQIDLRSAELLARKLLEVNTSAIIDLYELKPHERILFTKRFLDAMVNAPKNLWHPVLLLLDETHVFAPEGVKSESVGSVIDFASRGRKRGYCLVAASQRPAKLNKDVAAECNNKMIGRASLDIDMDRAAKELGFTSKEDKLKLRKLEPGEFFMFGSALVNEVTLAKINKVKTTHPLSGQRIGFTPAPASDKVRAMLSKLIDLPQQAEQELREIADYRRKVNELERELKSFKSNKETFVSQAQQQGKSVLMNDFKAKLNALQVLLNDKHSQEVAVLRQAYERELRELNNLLGQRNAGFVNIQSEIKNLMPVLNNLEKIVPGILRLRNLDFGKVTVYTRKRNILTKSGPTGFPTPYENRLPVEKETQFQKEVKPIGEIELSKPAKEIYALLLNNNDRTWNKIQIAAITGYSPNTGHFRNVIYELTSRELLEKKGNNFEAVASACDTFSPPELNLQRIKLKLSAGARKIFELLIEEKDRRPDGLSREEIGNSTQYSSGTGHFRNIIYEITSKELVVKGSEGLKLNPDLGDFV